MNHTSAPPYDSLLLVSFGGPEGPDEVMPFLENVLRGRNVPRERMLEVAEHYQRFGGVSPINRQCRELIEALRGEFTAQGIELPIYWGNRNWHPRLEPTLRQMRDEGRQRALAFFTNMFSCYSGCRQYRENIAAAREAVGPDAPTVDKLRFGFNHPGFIGAMAQRVEEAFASLGDPPRPTTPVLFTAHSIPLGMAQSSDYERQLRESCRLIAAQAGLDRWELVYQSRSGPPQQPWLEPDIVDSIHRLHQSEPLTHLVIVPVGFVSDHIEVLYDLDEEAAGACQQLGIQLGRAGTVGTHPKFVAMVAELVRERLQPGGERRALGPLGPWHDVCPADCCLYTLQRPAAKQP